MHHIGHMIAAHPDVDGAPDDALVRCIEQCCSCAQFCTSCADACLAEAMVDALRQCVRLNLDCADVRAASGAIAVRRTGSNPQVVVAILEACAQACHVCGAECERHADKHEHCRMCAEACRSCEAACREAIDAVRAGAGTESRATS